MQENTPGLTNGHSSTTEYLQTHFGPSTLQRFEVDSTVDKSLGQITTTSLERVDSESERSRSVGSVEELEGLIYTKEVEELLGEIRRVAIVLAHISRELLDKVRARSGTGRISNTFRLG